MGYPSIRDDVRVLGAHAKLHGVIVAKLSKAALRKVVDSDGAAEAYLAGVERRTQKLGELDMLSAGTKQLWLSEMYLEDAASLGQSAGAAAVAVRDRLSL